MEVGKSTYWKDDTGCQFMVGETIPRVLGGFFLTTARKPNVFPSQSSSDLRLSNRGARKLVPTTRFIVREGALLVIHNKFGVVAIPNLRFSGHGSKDYHASTHRTHEGRSSPTVIGKVQVGKKIPFIVIVSRSWNFWFMKTHFVSQR